MAISVNCFSLGKSIGLVRCHPRSGRIRIVREIGMHMCVAPVKVFGIFPTNSGGVVLGVAGIISCYLKLQIPMRAYAYSDSQTCLPFLPKSPCIHEPSGALAMSVQLTLSS